MLVRAPGPCLRRNGGLGHGGVDRTSTGPLLRIGNIRLGRAAKRRHAGIVAQEKKRRQKLRCDYRIETFTK